MSTEDRVMLDVLRHRIHDISVYRLEKLFKIVERMAVVVDLARESATDRAICGVCELSLAKCDEYSTRCLGKKFRAAISELDAEPRP